MKDKDKELELQKLAALQIYLNNDILFFSQYFFKAVHGQSFIVNPHHRIVCDGVNRLMEGKAPKLIINIAPRYSKTQIAVINHVANGLGRNPKAKFIHLSYSDDLVQTNSEAVLDILRTDQYKQVYGHFDIKKDSRAKKNWKTTQGGGMYSVATGGQVTGFGAGLVDNKDVWTSLRSEFTGVVSDDILQEFTEEATELIDQYGGSIIIDDPIKPEDAEHEIQRDAVNRRFDTTIKNRVNSRRTPILLMMQRVHPNDLAGHLMDAESSGWECIKIPSILTPEDMDKEWSYVDDNAQRQFGSMRDIFKYEYDLKIQKINNALKGVKQKKKIIEGNKYVEIIEKKKLELDRRDIEFPLSAWKHSLAELEQMRADDPVTFDRQYMQNPKPAFGLMYPRAWKTYEQLPPSGKISCYCDVADQGDDFLCAITYMEYMELKYVIDVVYTQNPNEETEISVSAMLDRNQVEYALFESNNGGRSFARHVEKICRHNGNDDTFFDWKYETSDKDSRIRNNSAKVQNLIVMPADWHIRWKKFNNHVSNYMNVGKNKYKDAPDALTGIVTNQPYGDRWGGVF